MPAGIPDYDELKLRIEPGAEGTYRILAFGPDGATASGSFVAPFTPLELDNFILRVGLPRRNVRSLGSSQMDEAKRFGARLFEALIQDDVRDAYLAAGRAAEAHERGLRVSLQLTNVPELMEVPWEFLYERPRFLSQSIYTPVVRSLDLKSVRPPPRLTLPLRILGVVSSPAGFDTLDVAAERHKLEQALSTLIAEGMVELEWLERATMSELDRTVGAPDELHVIHYIGHGAYDERSEGGVVVLEDSRGTPHEVTGEQLASVLQDERSLGLAVLNACEGARTSHVDPFSGVAASLVQCGIPAVIGMQFEITDEAAIAFAERLYAALAQGFPVDAALAQARRAIFTAGSDIEFGTPVLFLRSGATRLFEIDAARRRPAPPPKESAPASPKREQPSDLPTLRVNEVAQQISGFERLYLRKSLKRLPALLEAGELVHGAASGSVNTMMGTDGLVLVTDRRLLFVTGSEDRDVSIRFADVSAAETTKGAMDTFKLLVTTGQDVTTIAGLSSDQAERILPLLRRAGGL